MEKLEITGEATATWGRPRKAHNEIGANPVDAALLVVQHAHEDGHDRQDHDYFNGYRQYADEGAHRPVQ
jgi:hypothetical protein